MEEEKKKRKRRKKKEEQKKKKEENKKGSGEKKVRGENKLVIIEEGEIKLKMESKIYDWCVKKYVSKKGHFPHQKLERRKKKERR